ncbi:MAG TPA: UDP-3-O-(3-hydroxymyristoyl)glucosamine N-acyltransferase [Candidatus Sulfotelmatobacter sp.]|jgi:UDP-3-O-[3-hydroxymyristoyl] glucosamine N-acyltransferase
MKRSLQEIAEAVGARVVGNGSVEVSGLASIASAGEGDLVFVEDEKYLASALASKAAAVIAAENTSSVSASGKPLLICGHPKLAFARAGQLLQSDARRGQSGVQESAVVHVSARLGARVMVEARAVISENAEIGDGSRIRAGCVIGRGVRIGRDCEIYPNVTIYSGTTLGDRVIVHAGAVLGSDGFGYVRDVASGKHEKFPQIGKLVIEDDVEIGANSTIDRGALDETRIGRGTKIDNLVHVGHNCRVGEDVVIAAQTGISGSVVIEKNVVIGGQVGLGDHVRLTEGVILGSQCGVLPNKVLRGKGVVFWGTPARPLAQYLKTLAELARLGKKR